VLAQEILAGQLLVEMDDMRRIAIDAAEVVTVLRRGNSRGKPKQRPEREAAPEAGGDVAVEEQLEELADAEDADWTGEEPHGDDEEG
jgi:hypothetical protein